MRGRHELLGAGLASGASVRAAQVTGRSWNTPLDTALTAPDPEVRSPDQVASARRTAAMGAVLLGQKSGRRHPRTAVGHCPVRFEADGGGAWAKRLVPSGTGVGTRGPYHRAAVGLSIHNDGSSDPITSRPHC